MAPAPNPEISDFPKKRTFSAEEKHRILLEAENCIQPGQISALLRREGIYSSYLTTWRRTLLTQGKQGLTPEKPGRKMIPETEREVERLQQKVLSLEEKLHRANLIIEAQKKVSSILAEGLQTLSNPQL
jgi:transposase-like protein